MLGTKLAYKDIPKYQDESKELYLGNPTSYRFQNECVFANYYKFYTQKV